MMNGSATLDGYSPDFDATIVTRHARRRRGKSLAQGSLRVVLYFRRQPYHLDWSGAYNPHKMELSAGGVGRSSGSEAVVVALGEKDMT